MKKVLVVGLNNSISQFIKSHPEKFSGWDFSFTQSKNANDQENIYLNFLGPDFGINNNLLGSVDQIVFLSSYYGEERSEMSYFVSNIKKFISSYVELRKENARIIFFGSIAADKDGSMYAEFKSHIKEISETVNHEHNAKTISATYLNLGSFRDNAVEGSNNQIKTDYVVELLRFILSLPVNVKMDNAGFMALSE